MAKMVNCIRWTVVVFVVERTQVSTIRCGYSCTFDVDPFWKRSFFTPHTGNDVVDTRRLITNVTLVTHRHAETHLAREQRNDDETETMFY